MSSHDSIYLRINDFMCGHVPTKATRRILSPPDSLSQQIRKHGNECIV